MKTRKRNIICLVGALAIVAGLFAILPSNLKANKLLSDADLASLWGGEKWCDPSCLSKNCDCKSTIDCEDIVCSPCKYLAGIVSYDTHNKWCTGNSGNTTNVTACFKTTTESDECSYTGDGYNTSCEADVFDSSSCSTKTHDDKTVGTKDCT